MAGGSDSTQRNLLGSLERQANVADSGLITPAARVSLASTFGEQSLCKTAETTGDIAASIIAGRLLIEGSGETRLREQLKFYFSKIGITNETQWAQMADGDFPTNWFGDYPASTDTLNVPVMTCLKVITGMIAVVNRQATPCGSCLFHNYLVGLAAWCR